MNAVMKALSVCREGVKSRARSGLRRGLVGSAVQGIGQQCVRLSMARRWDGRFHSRIAWSEAGGYVCSSVNAVDASTAQSLSDQISAVARVFE